MKGLQEVLAALGSLKEPAVLATLVRVKGSSYRKPGARMVLDAGGSQTGVLSAGCLETDLKARVADVLAGGQSQVAAFDLGSDLDLIWGTGMGCQGQADVLLEAVRPGQPAPWMPLAARLLDGRRSAVLATVFGARGGAEHPIGDRFLLDPQGQSLLPPAGPFAVELARTMEAALLRGAPASLTLPSGTGELDLLIEPLLPPFALWLFGAGEHARPLARLAKELGWYLGLVDHRPALATAERFPEADRIVLGQLPDGLEGITFDSRSAALVVSHIYERDRQALAALFPRPLGYLGLQGNRNRCAKLLKELEVEGLVLSEAQRQILHAPAGLDLGAESPEAIALSMLAEVLAVLSGHKGGSLRERAGPIHRAAQAPNTDKATPAP
jgi:xanthine/CO dehydrogenase XdhC/CoxF family maturation factor